MFQLMIIDDNPYILQELTTTIDWEDFNFNLAGSFLDSKELLHAAAEIIPDLVITDIFMPQINGLQLTERLYAINPNIKIVFISEHSEFEYAKRALNLQVFDYLVKPLQQDQLIDVMKRISSLLLKEKKNFLNQLLVQSQHDFYRKKALSHYASRLLFYPENEAEIRNEFVKLGLSLPDICQSYVVCYTLDHDLEDYDQFRTFLENTLSDVQVIPIRLDNHHGIFLLINDTETISISEQLARLCIDMESQFNICITVGYSNASHDFSALPKLYEQAQAAIKHLIDSGINIPIIAYQAIQAKATEPKITGSTPKEYSENIIRMRAYIENNYMLPITTHDVAHSVYFSSSYANSCFNNECGTTIFGYITQVRMEKAKDFLINTDEQVSRIAELVGYSGKTSFYLAFRRYTCVSPTEFRTKNTIIQ